VDQADQRLAGGQVGEQVGPAQWPARVEGDLLAQPGAVPLGGDLAAHPDPTRGDGTRLRQEVTFHPRGPLGVAYLLSDLPARETLISLVHSRTRRELIGALED
jgi:hypothetical protein